MKILVVDDESPIRECLRQLLAETDGDHELAGEAADGDEAIARCRAQPIDLVLMDTQMPGMTGIEAARQLALLDQPPTVILMSASDAIGSGNSERPVAGCLRKPVRPERLREALRLARVLVRPPERGSPPMPIRPIDSGRRESISAWYRGGLHSVAIDDIIYLRADQKYVNVRHLKGNLLVDESLRSFEQEFPDLFLRIHRNALVAKAQLVGLEKQSDGSTRVRLIDCDDRLAVSRRHLPDIRRWLRETENARRDH